MLHNNMRKKNNNKKERRRTVRPEFGLPYPYGRGVGLDFGCFVGSIIQIIGAFYHCFFKFFNFYINIRKCFLIKIK